MTNREVIHIEELPDGGWLEHYSDGRIRAKNAAGQLMKHPANYTPKEVASELGKSGAKIQQDEVTDELLDYLGLDGPFYEQLARVLVRGGSAAVSSSKELLKASREHGALHVDRVKVQPGQICPSCKQYVLQGLQLTDDELTTVKEYLAKLRAELEADAIDKPWRGSWQSTRTR